jgi:hypothetical protein
MKVYIDSEYRCHTTNTDGNFREVEHSFFDGKCTTFIEGYRFVPSGESWARSDGVVFHGEMISPWKDYNELEAIQIAYERQLLADYESALAEIEKALGVYNT